eukprot:TRINITY_DN1187_c3_g1_i1.p1 TRINITY_DN1187_c3_g1~~TRINITY_DN1187_c3_g1_i1.p1  ORF type:complete len:121 (+),score=34.61 TRINITY_DN1187_c3_g1_i1:26-364(+)
MFNMFKLLLFQPQDWLTENALRWSAPSIVVNYKQVGDLQIPCAKQLFYAAQDRFQMHRFEFAPKKFVFVDIDNTQMNKLNRHILQMELEKALKVDKVGALEDILQKILLKEW